MFCFSHVISIRRQRRRQKTMKGFPLVTVIGFSMIGDMILVEGLGAVNLSLNVGSAMFQGRIL